MNHERAVDDLIRAWLRKEAPPELPDRVLEATFERTRASRQRRALLGWRVLPMRRMSPGALAVGAAAIALVVVGVGLLSGRLGSVGGPPSPSPTVTAPSPTVARPSATPAASLVPISIAGQVAFTRTVDGNTDLYVMNLDRTGLARLTTDPAKDTKPAWSPDGKKIVFIRGTDQARDVYVMNADGTGVVQLTASPEGEDSAVFSPDGSQIVFSRYVDPAFFDIYVMASDGTGQRLVYHRDGAFTCCAVFSHDGSAILFNQDLSAGGGIDIMRLVLATSVLTSVIDGPGDDSSFALSPDGTTIAFQSDRSPGGEFLANADGSNVRHLTGTSQKGTPVSWSPDGLHLVLGATDGWIYLVSVDGGETVKWARGEVDVAWRPQP